MYSKSLFRSAMHLNFPDLGSGALPDEPSAAVTVHFRQGDSVPALVAWLTSGSGSTTPCRLTLDASGAKLGTDGGRQLAQALASNCAVTSVSVKSLSPGAADAILTRPPPRAPCTVISYVAPC